MLSIFESKTNGPEAAKRLLDLLHVKVTATTLTREIEEHPDYPSLLSISDVLNNHGVENMGIRVDPQKLEELPCPFITQVKGVKGGAEFFTVVREVSKNTIHFFEQEKNQWTSLAKEDFLKRWSGVALLAEAKDDAGEKDYNKKIKEENRKNIIQYLSAFCIPVIAIIAGLMALVQSGTTALLPFAFSLLTLAGAITGALLLWYELDQHNPVLQQICSAGKKVNCGAILQSKAAKIAGISWSAIGFSYFMGILLLLLFSGVTNPAVLFVASWLNVIAVPYVVFSIYYQWRIAKQWCVLCLCVQGLLVLQLAATLTGGWHTLLSLSAIEPGLIISTVTALVIPFIVVTLLIPAFQKAKESKRTSNELQKLKHNQEIFEALLQKQKMLTNVPGDLGITLGNPNGAYKLIKVCNPYCGPCAKAHQPMEDLLENNPDVRIQILFTATNSDEDMKAPPVKHLLAIAEKNEESIVKRALDDWYLAEKKDYEVFAAKYPMNGELKQQNAKVEAMKNWCDTTGIEFTPTFFVSMPSEGNETVYYQLPSIYSVVDLKYFFAV
ncbi:vitamin K epoxide reductase family protein [Mucilaginibacter sp. RCC_168]|uniref:vitamin K epoxide reductase family protein n=1 Tax=Mucilaginibacter sp. RCC_168 TaxID=3239221 RepID=UPI0035267DF9